MKVRHLPPAVMEELREVVGGQRVFEGLPEKSAARPNVSSAKSSTMSPTV